MFHHCCIPSYVFHDHVKLNHSVAFYSSSVKCPPSLFLDKCFRKAHSLLLTKLPLFASSLQPISILPSSCLKTKTNQTNPKTLLCLCKCLVFHLSLTPFSSSFSRGACASSPPHHPLTKQWLDTITTLKLLILRQSLPPLHSLPSGTAATIIFSLDKLLSLAFQVSPVLGSSEGSLLSSRKSWHFSEGGIQMRISSLPFQRYRYEPGSIYQEIKMPTGTPIHSLISSNCERF